MKYVQNSFVAWLLQMSFRDAFRESSLLLPVAFRDSGFFENSAQKVWKVVLKTSGKLGQTVQ